MCECNMSKVTGMCMAIIALVIAIVIILCSNTPIENKNILTAIAREGDNTEVGNAIIKFSLNDIEEGTAIMHQAGSENININESGIYQISYQVFGTGQRLGTFNFNTVLIVNGVGLPDTFNESPILRDNVVNRMTLTSTVILRLEAGDILNLGAVSIEDVTYPRARIDIEKIG